MKTLIKHKNLSVLITNKESFESFYESKLRSLFELTLCGDIDGNHPCFDERIEHIYNVSYKDFLDETFDDYIN